MARERLPKPRRSVRVRRAIVRTLKKYLLKLVRLATLVVIIGLTGGLVAGGIVAAAVAAFSPEYGGLKNTTAFRVKPLGDLKPLDIRSQVFDRYGNLIATWRGVQNRVPVPLEKVPKSLVQAILDLEDSEFYNHVGVNVKGWIRATAANVEAGGISQGGSTITQQLVKLSILDSRQDLKRKINEALIARRIEKVMTKDEILEQYLNTIYFGEGAYGVQAAAEQYFAKSVENLSTVESAFLAGMIRNPVGYDPLRFRDRSRERRTTVLFRMKSLGHITEKEYEEFRRMPMPRPADRLAKPETYFLEAVKQSLLDDPRLGKSKSDRFNAVFSGGLTIRTTFDPQAQSNAEQAIAQTLPASAAPDFTAALVSVDVETGAVRSMVGGPGFDTYKYNLVTQGARQPGSSWKPFVFIAALESGISPKSVVSGAEPCPIPNPNGKPNPYYPHNSSEGEGTTESIVNHLVRSNNCAYARLAWIVGYDRVKSVAVRLGITSSRIDLVPSMALGTEEVRPIDMAGAYASIASQGKLRTPFLVEEVLDRNGNTLIEADHGGRQVIPPEVAKTAVAAMQRVVSNGTGTAAGLATRQVAGKTGTTNEYSDAWFVGFTDQTATAVWMGAPDGQKPMLNVGGIKVKGGTYPAEIFHRYMAIQTALDPVVLFPTPDLALFEKGQCLSIESVIAQQKEAERAAAKAIRDAQREADRLKRKAARAQREADRAKKAAERKAAKTKSSNTPGPVVAPAMARGFGVWFPSAISWFSSINAQDQPAPVPAAAAIEQPPSPAPAPEPVPEIDANGEATLPPSPERAPKNKSKKKTVTSKTKDRNKTAVTRFTGCSDDALFTAREGNSANTDNAAKSKTKSKKKTSTKKRKSTRIAVDTSGSSGQGDQTPSIDEPSPT